jgi:hypothetical protein
MMLRDFGLFLIPTTFIVTAGCSNSDAQITNLADIQRLARIDIPASARNIKCATDAVYRGPNVATYGRFDIPKADLHLVLGGMPAEQKAKPYEGYSNVTSRKISQPWWQPEALKRKQVADWSMPSYSVNLLIGEDGSGDTVTVYFFNFSL